MQKIEAKTVKAIKRLTNSYNGNPNFEFAFTVGPNLRTKNDVSFAYAVGPQMVGQRFDVVIETSKSGRARIVDMK